MLQSEITSITIKSSGECTIIALKNTLTFVRGERKIRRSKNYDMILIIEICIDILRQGKIATSLLKILYMLKPSFAKKKDYLLNYLNIYILRKYPTNYDNL